MHTSTYTAEMQQRQPLLCSVAHIHFLKSFIRAEPQKSKQIEDYTVIINTIKGLDYDSCKLNCFIT